MKKYIKSVTALEQGSYLLSRSGKLTPVRMHVPSSTYVGRGIPRLAPTDAEHLLNIGKISESDARDIVMYEYMQFLGDKAISAFDPISQTQFMNYAELRFAPKVRDLFVESVTGNGGFDRHNAEDLSNTFYSLLRDSYVKVSVLGDVIEFRIQSEDGFDWNSVIVDDVLLEYPINSMRINIVRESSKGYRAYFIDASLDDILENDSAVLASTLLSRKIIMDKIVYTPKN